MSHYYNIDGNPITLDEWSKTYTENQRIALDKIEGIEISTVWLGINHQYGEGPPLIFETMIFGGEHDEYQERYSTLEQAKEGHAKAIRLVRSTQKN